MTNNKYSNLKIIHFPEKLQSFRDGKITAPIYVRLKPINRCNHDCFFCVYASGYRKETPPTNGIDHIVSKMHEDMVESDTIPTAKMLEVLQDFHEMGVKAVTYSGGGEPLLHKDIVQMMQQTLDYGIDLSIITNGQLLTGKRAQVLAKAKWVRVSIDYTSADEMMRFRHVPERMFEDVLSNLKEFDEIRDPGCDLGINYIVHRDNCKDLVGIAKRLKECGVDNIRFSPMWVPGIENYHAPIKEHVEKQLRECQALCDGTMTINTTYDFNSPAHGTKRSYEKCFFMQTVPVVGADMNVYACHNKAYDNKGKIGSIADKRFKELWFSAEAKHVFDTLNPKHDCCHQCANDMKNHVINDVLAATMDSFV